MLTSSERLDIAADPTRYSAPTASPNIGGMHEIGAIRETRVRRIADDNLRSMTSQFDSSFAQEPKLIDSHFSQQDTDRKSNLHSQILAYWAERLRDPSAALAVNDALKFTDLVPATAILPRVAGVTDYSIPITTSQFDGSFAREQWLIGSNFNRHDTDRKSNLRKQVLSYWAERPRDSSVVQAVNDALKFIDLVPATAVLPHVAFAEDDEVNFFWRQDGLFIDIGFVGDGMMHYYVSADAQGVDSDASIQFIGRSLPRDIMKTIPTVRDEYGKDSHGRVY